jgi:hypothetical protein
LAGRIACPKGLPERNKRRQKSPPIRALQGASQLRFYSGRFLLAIFEKATRSGFAFNYEKIRECFFESRITITTRQLAYKFDLLKINLRARDRVQYLQIARINGPLPHPIFRVVKGDIETWERARSQILFEKC